MISQKNILLTTLILVAMGFTMLLYWPGLNGGLLLDDHNNLNKLLRSSTLDATELLYFTLSGQGGPVGRPISLTTFVLNYFTTGNDIWFFKFTNLLLHLLNGLLIFFLIKKLIAWLQEDIKTSDRIALVTAALWLVHPLNVSTTLYVIQRMTELSAMFTLLGLLAYIKARERSLVAGLKSAVPWLIVIASATILAVLSKETGILMLSLIGVMEFCLFNRRHCLPLSLKILIAAAALSPLLVLVYYFKTNVVFAKISGEFTTVERLLTQSRILWTYLGQIFFPNIAQMGIFHDDIALSKNLLTPPITLLALLGIAFLIATILTTAKRYPVISFSIAWFLVGHVLESTTISLEIYFDHRNYLPMLGPIFGLTWFLLNSKLSLLKNIRKIFAAILFIFFSWLTFQNTQLWSSNALLAEYWARQRPESVSAQLFLGDWAVKNGLVNLAKYQAQRAVELRPNVVTNHMNLILTQCLAGEQILDTVVKDTLAIAKTSPIHKSLMPSIKQLTEVTIHRSCQGFDRVSLLSLLQQLKENTKLNDSMIRSFLWETEAIVHVTSQSPALALASTALAHAIKIRPNLRILLWQTKLATADGNFAEAKKHLAAAEEFLNNAGWVERLNRTDRMDMRQLIIKNE